MLGRSIFLLPVKPKNTMTQWKGPSRSQGASSPARRHLQGGFGRQRRAEDCCQQE